MAKKFGTTWWGEQWLNSLTHIDYGNRLPRGARYARNGSVRSIDIKGGDIKARVQGSRPTPYKETITVPQFDPDKVKVFVDRILEHPLILASLMQRKLDPEVLKIAKEVGLQVFPTSWKDLGMACSCPDWAVPCKHLAAVIYKISEEIDNNPFLVFQLHGLDLLDELKKRGVGVGAIVQTLSPMEISRLIETAPASDKPVDSSEWGSIRADFSRLPEIGEDLVELLADNPPFSIDSDFKKLYLKSLSTISKNLAKDMKAVNEGSERPMEIIDGGVEVAFHIGKDFDTEVLLTPMVGLKVTKLTFGDFVNRLSDISPTAYLTSQPWVETMKKVWLYAANLIVRKDIVPRIVSIGKKYRIIWSPACLHPAINEMTQEISRAVPNIVSFGSKKEYLTNSGEWLISCVLNSIIAGYGQRLSIHDQLFDLFFLDEPQTFDGIGQSGIAGGIRVWTDKFFMLNSGVGFELKVDENDEQFSVDMIVKSQEEDRMSEGKSLEDYIESEGRTSAGLKAMMKLSSLADYMPRLREYIHSQGRIPMRFDSKSFIPFLFKTIPLMRLLGVGVILPKSLHNLVKPKVTVRIDSQGRDNPKAYIRLDQLLSFDWEIALGDIFITPEEFKTLFQRAGELVKFKGQYIYATPEELEKIQKELAKITKLTSSEILAIALAEKYNDAPVILTESCKRVLNTLRSMPQQPLPQGLRAELRPYQRRGYDWMIHNLSMGFGAIIADDMGLGKTLQVIAVLLQLKESGRLAKHKGLVVVPTGLLTNWQKECSRFAPDLKVGVYHGQGRDLEKFDGDILLTSYGVTRSDAAKLKKLKWEILVIDEAQNIKNTATAQTKAINSLSASSHIAMSGTPVENRLSEYWSIMNFANKGLLGSLKTFNSKYTRPIELDGNREAIEQFKAVTSPFMLRRLKSDKSIISDLPDKIERDEYATLTPQQTALYQQTLNEAMREIEGVEATDHASLFKRQGLVLQMILALKQICNHPAQFLKTRQADADLSGKAMMLLDLVKGIVESGEKVLIFTQFKEMGDLIVEMLRKADISSLFYHGGATLKNRTEMVERFQTQRSAQVFVLSLKAAGTGLNLTAASNVIHFDLWWNPAVEAQATDRAYRIGQHSNVQVFRFITKGTFEEKINAMIQDKKQLAELTVGSGEKWLASMTDSELRSIFTLD